MPDFEAIANAIRSRFKTQVEDIIDDGLPTHYDNAPFNIPADGRWARVKVIFEESEQMSISTPKTSRVFGLMLVSIFIAFRTGDREALNVGDFIVRKFRAITDTNVIFRTPSLVSIGRRDKEWQVDVRCPFFVDDTV